MDLVVHKNIELVVDGGGQCNVDIRGWIIDDNNGEFGTGTGKGIAPGHIRFKNNAQWSNVKSGTIILVYNNLEKNPNLPTDDLTDSNLDMIYVLPANNTTYLEGTSLRPNYNGTTLVTDPTYSPVTYGTASWTSIGLANSGDAAQIRKPDGTYFHGFAYGSGLNGGTDNLWFSGTGGGKVYVFNSENYRDTSKIDVLPVAGNETPGAPNNTLNQSFISNLICVLPIHFLDFKVKSYPNYNLIQWKTEEQETIQLYRNDVLINITDKTSYIDYTDIENCYYYIASEDGTRTETLWVKSIIENTKIIKQTDIYGRDITEDYMGVYFNHYENFKIIKKIKF